MSVTVAARNIHLIGKVALIVILGRNLILKCVIQISCPRYKEQTRYYYGYTCIA